MGRFIGVKGCIWGVLETFGASLGRLGATLGRLGGVLGRLGASLGRRGVSFGPQDGVLGRLRNVSGTCLGRVVAFSKIYNRTAVEMHILRLISVLTSS